MEATLFTTYLNIGKEHKEALSINVKDWYSTNYPCDELTKKINPNLTFYEVYMGLLFDGVEEVYTSCDLYDMLYVFDSVIRERIFEYLNKAMKYNYDNFIYNLWITNFKEANLVSLSDMFEMLYVKPKEQEANTLKNNIEDSFLYCQNLFNDNAKLIVTIRPNIKFEGDWKNEYEDNVIASYLRELSK